MEIFPSGGLIFGEGAYWELKPSNLYNANKITFMSEGIALYDVPENLRVVEDLDPIGDIENISSQYKTELSPRIE